MEYAELDIEGRKKATRAVVAAIFAVLLLFLVVLSIGQPIVTLGRNAGASDAYAVGIFIPVALVCILALTKSSKTT